MGSNTLSLATPGQDIPADHHNELVQALLNEIVPRDASRVAVDLAANLGTSALRFLRAYAANFHIGTASNNLKIYEGAANEIWIERGGTSNEIIKLRNGTIEFWKSGASVFSLNASGIVWTTQANKSIPHAKLANKDFEQASSSDHNDTGTSYSTYQSFSYAFKQNTRYRIEYIAKSISGEGDLSLQVNSDEKKEYHFDLFVPNHTHSLSGPGSSDGFKILSAPLYCVAYYNHTGADASLTVRVRGKTNQPSVGLFINNGQLACYPI